MRSLFRLVLLAALAPAAYAQVLPGDLLLNSFGSDVLVHYRTDGTVVQTTGSGTGSLWVGAAILPDGNWVTVRGGPAKGVNIFDCVTGTEIATWDLPPIFGFPGDVGVFSDGTLAIVDMAGTVWRFDTAGKKIANFDQTGKVLGSIDVGPANHPLFLTVFAPLREDIGDNYCGPANLNSTGQSALISAFGSTTASFNLVTLTATQLPQNVFGYFLNSDVQDFKPFAGGSQGNLCLGGAIGRHAKQIANSGPAGELIIDVDLTALPRPGGTHSVVGGETWNFQCWFRDKVGGVPTSNFTDGIEIVFK